MAKVKPSRPKQPSQGTTRRSVSKSVNRSKGRNADPPKQQKTRRPMSSAKSKNRKIYTDEELGISKLNSIIPAGVQKPRGKKKGKVFVDDAEGMMTILAIVNADKEGQIESKMVKARQLEEIREARRKEAEKREERRKGKLEEAKGDIKRKRKRPTAKKSIEEMDSPEQKNEKRVAFA